MHVHSGLTQRVLLFLCAATSCELPPTVWTQAEKVARDLAKVSDSDIHRHAALFTFALAMLRVDLASVQPDFPLALPPAFLTSSHQQLDRMTQKREEVDWRSVCEDRLELAQ